MSGEIAALDRALAEYGEDIILRRVMGSGAGAINADVLCRARVDAQVSGPSAPGPKTSVFDIIISPTQINALNWPGDENAVAPFDVDQRIPRIDGPDKIIMRGHNPRTITFSDPKIIGGVLVRLNLRVVG